MKKKYIHLLISLIVVVITIGVLFAFKNHFSTKNTINAQNDIDKCIDTINLYYNSLNKAEYEKCYDTIYKSKFASYQELKKYWEQSYNNIKINSIKKYKIKNQGADTEIAFKLSIYIDYKDNPSKYVTDDIKDGDRISFLTMKKDNSDQWKIYKYTPLP